MTTIWYRLSAPEKNLSSQKPIAFVEQSKDEIQRRPVTRILWQLITDGEPVYAGEAIRTSSKGEVRIQFVGGSRFIDLEPDSLIVISQSAEKEISLDLMDGGLQVNQSVANSEVGIGPALTLKSGNAKVDLSSATAALSKAGSGEIDLQVLKGTAKVEAGGQTTEMNSGKSGSLSTTGVELSTSQIQILSPALDKPTFFNSLEADNVLFSWKGVPESSKVTLLAGRSRKALKPVGSTAEAKLEAMLSPGKHYWKLVVQTANNEALAETPVYKLDISTLLAPALLSPLAGERLVKSEELEEIEFRWTKPNEAKSILVEIATDPQLKNKILSENFPQAVSLKKTLLDGDYYLRLSAYYEGSATAASSKLYLLPVGSKSKAPPKEIQWTDVGGNGPQYYVEQPTLMAGWDLVGKEHIKIWRLKIARTEEELKLNAGEVFETKEMSYKVSLKKPGRYLAMVEAFGERNTLLAVSKPKPIEVAPVPLLGPTNILPDGQDLKANLDGRLNVQWQAIEGAAHYVATLTDSTGNEIKREKTSRTLASFPSLLPGVYQVQVVCIDHYGRAGEKSLSRKATVPDSSGLSTPKVRKIKVR